MRHLDEAIERSASPADSRRVLERLGPDAAKVLADDPALVAATVAVTGVSRSLSRVVETDPEALSVLAALDERPPVGGDTAGRAGAVEDPGGAADRRP